MDFAKLIERAKAICLSPKTEWPKIAAEPRDIKSIYLYAMVLAAIPAICGFIGSTLIGTQVPGMGTIRIPIGVGLVNLILGYGLGLGAIYLIALIISALAPSFDGQKDLAQAFKVAVYTSTPVWLAGVFNIIPLLSILTLIAALYAIYLMYLGLPVLMQNPPGKTVVYLIVIIVISIIVFIVVGAILGAIVGMIAGPAAMTGGLLD